MAINKRGFIYLLPGILLSGFLICWLNLTVFQTVMALEQVDELAPGNPAIRTPVDFEGTRPAHWRVIWTEAPERNATLSWSTARSGERHVVYYDTIPRYGKVSAYRYKTEAYRSGRYSDFNRWAAGAEEAFYHHVRLSDLKPAQVYYFIMTSDDQRSPELHFYTAPDTDGHFSIMMGGDSRSGFSDRKKINIMIAERAEKNKGILAFAHAGDYVNDGESWEDWKKWLEHLELTVSESGRILPVIPARGNHDRGPLYDEIFDNPGREAMNYFVTMIGRSFMLITLNSEISTGGLQKRWLEKQLRLKSSENRWLVVQYHRPLFPAVKSPGAAKPHWVPLFEKYGVDMAYESDGHVIKRTLPIRNNRFDPTGVVYTGEGGLGVKQRKPKTGRWYLTPPGMGGRGHHFVLIDVSPLSMVYRVIMLDRTIRDTYTFYP